MKKTLGILLIVSLLILCGCTNRKPITTTTLPTTTLPTIEYQIYCDAPESAVRNEDESDAELFYSTTELDFSYSSTKVATNPNAEQIKTFSVGKQTYSIPIFKSEETSLASLDQKELQYLGQYDVYDGNTDDGRITASFFQGSNELRFFLAYNKLNQPGNLTQEAARECADAQFIAMYGEALLSEYSQVVEMLSNDSTYVFAYRRTICGYSTYDSVTIEINRKGEVCSINAKQFGILTPLKNELSAEKISAAEKVLTGSISKSYEVQGKYLLLDAMSGKCYLQLVVARSIDDGYEGNFFYINVN